MGYIASIIFFIKNFFILILIKRRKKYQLQTVPVLFHESFQKLCMVDFCIVQNHDSLSMRIPGKYIFQKLQKHFCIIFLVFFHINVVCLIIQTANQFYSLMLSISWYDPLSPAFGSQIPFHWL